MNKDRDNIFEEELDKELTDSNAEGEYAEVYSDEEDFPGPEEVDEVIRELDVEARKTKPSFLDIVSSIVDSKYGKIKLGAVILLLIVAVGFTVAAIAGAFSKKGNDAESSSDSSLNESSSSFVSVEEVIRDEEFYDSVVLKETDNAGDNYIQDTLFIGDSNTVRLSYYGVVPSQNTAGIVGIGIGDIDAIKGVFFYNLNESPTTVLRAVELMQPRRIIMNFGTNDVDRDNVKAFINSYREAVAQVQKTYKYADIIIDSIHPVNATGDYPLVKQSVIDEYNKELEKLAEELGLHYLNSCEALKGTNGYAKSGYVDSDGIHLTPTGMKAYVNYVKTHSHIVEDTRPEVTNVPKRKEVEFVPGGSGTGKKAERADKGTILATVNDSLSGSGYKFDPGDVDFSDASKWQVKNYTVNIAEDTYKKGNEQSIAATIINTVTGVKADYVSTSMYETSDNTGAIFTLKAYTKVEAPKYTITVSAGAGGTASANKTEAIENDVVSISAKADSGYKFAGWTISGGTVTDLNSTSTTLTVGKSNVTVTATFAKEEPASSSSTPQSSSSTPASSSHVHSYTETVTKNPTCTEAGTKTLKCSCGDTKEEPIPATGHKWGTTPIVDKPAGPGTEGSQHYVCSVCGAQKSETIPALPPDSSSEEPPAPPDSSSEEPPAPPESSSEEPPAPPVSSEEPPAPPVSSEEPPVTPPETPSEEPSTPPPSNEGTEGG